MRERGVPRTKTTVLMGGQVVASRRAALRVGSGVRALARKLGETPGAGAGDPCSLGCPPPGAGSTCLRVLGLGFCPASVMSFCQSELPPPPPSPARSVRAVC